MTRAKPKPEKRDPMEEAVIRSLTAVTLKAAVAINVEHTWDDQRGNTDRFEIVHVPMLSRMGPADLLAAEEQFAERAMLYWADKVNELRAAKNQPLMPATPEPKKTRRKR